MCDGSKHTRVRWPATTRVLLWKRNNGKSLKRGEDARGTETEEKMIQNEFFWRSNLSRPLVSWITKICFNGQKTPRTFANILAHVHGGTIIFLSLNTHDLTRGCRWKLYGISILVAWSFFMSAFYEVAKICMSIFSPVMNFCSSTLTVFIPSRLITPPQAKQTTLLLHSRKKSALWRKE